MHGTAGVSIERVHEIGQAFARHDVEAIVKAFAADGVFRNARGPDVSGRSYTGHAEIRAFFHALFANSPDITWRHTAEYVAGNRAVTEWHRTATTPAGETQSWLGCDLYTFRGDLIVLKDTYIKVVG